MMTTDKKNAQWKSIENMINAFVLGSDDTLAMEQDESDAFDPIMEEVDEAELAATIGEYLEI